MGNIGSSEIIVLGIIAVLIFGSKRSGEMARELGKTKKEFEKAKKEYEDALTDATDELSDIEDATEANNDPKQSS